MPFGPHWLPLLIIGLDTLFLLFSLFWLWMLIDCLLNKTLHNSQKILWVLLILFTHIFGAVFYFLYKRTSASTLTSMELQAEQQPQELYIPYQQSYQENSPYHQRSKRQKPHEEPQAYYPEQ